jgi:hypothetical protein
MYDPALVMGDPTLDLISQTIDQAFCDPADRMMLKLYLDQYGIEEIARFSGEPEARVRQRVTGGILLLEDRLGCLSGTIQMLCVHANVATHYRPLHPTNSQ